MRARPRGYSLCAICVSLVSRRAQSISFLYITSHTCPMRLYWFDLQACSNGTRAILHDVKPPPRPKVGIGGNSNPIVDYTQLDSTGRTSHPYSDFARAGIFVRVNYGFACDPIEMQSYGRIPNGNFFVGLQAARRNFRSGFDR